MKKIKILSFLLIVIMSISTLVSCGDKELTVEEFNNIMQNNGFEVDTDENPMDGATVRSGGQSKRMKFEFYVMSSESDAEKFFSEHKNEIMNDSTPLEVSETYYSARHNDRVYFVSRIGKTVLFGNTKSSEYETEFFTLIEELGYNN